MKLHEKIFRLRKQSGMSQEEVAEKLNISRQALSRWENGSAQPMATNIVELSKLFGVTSDYLLNDEYQSDNDIPVVAETKKINYILRANLIKIAIISQASILNIVIQPISEDMPQNIVVWFRIVELVLLTATSIWMACNHRYETDLKQRAKNTKIELVYCIVQLIVASLAYYTHLYFLGTILLITVCIVYLLKINPKYMNRKLTK